MLGSIDITKTAFSSQGVDIALLVLAIIAAVTQYIMTKQTSQPVSQVSEFRDIMADTAAVKKLTPAR